MNGHNYDTNARLVDIYFVCACHVYGFTGLNAMVEHVEQYLSASRGWDNDTWEAVDGQKSIDIAALIAIGRRAERM